MFQDNTFDSNVGLHGGAVHIDVSGTHEDEMGAGEWSSAPFILFKNNTFTRNMAYFEGNAIYIKNGQVKDGE